MWPECVAGRDFEGFDNEDSAVIDDIVSLGKNMGLEGGRRPSGSEAEVSGAKRQKKEKGSPSKQ